MKGALGGFPSSTAFWGASFVTQCAVCLDCPRDAPWACQLLEQEQVPACRTAIALHLCNGFSFPTESARCAERAQSAGLSPRSDTEHSASPALQHHGDLPASGRERGPDPVKRAAEQCPECHSQHRHSGQADQVVWGSCRSPLGRASEGLSFYSVARACSSV